MDSNHCTARLGVQLRVEEGIAKLKRYLMGAWNPKTTASDVLFCSTRATAVVLHLKVLMAQRRLAGLHSKLLSRINYSIGVLAGLNGGGRTSVQLREVVAG
jgi:hypothetical protein